MIYLLLLSTLWSCQSKKPLRLGNKQSGKSTVVIVEELSEPKQRDVLSDLNTWYIPVERIPFPAPANNDEEFCVAVCMAMLNPVLGYSSEWKLRPEDVQQCRLEMLPEWETHVTEYQRTEDREAGERLVGYAECTVDYIPIGPIPQCALCEPGLRAGD